MAYLWEGGDGDFQDIAGREMRVMQSVMQRRVKAGPKKPTAKKAAAEQAGEERSLRVGRIAAILTSPMPTGPDSRQR